ncbi:unnamed protein product [Prorocentrum cordatum]|uniref:Transmembrane protein n=1 Tax=Prorocentrum cordatum TaxID=2364126 RepID=A0ABN9T5Z0_9DINO|nr:unnamed protein product [Polarella glacialis]
MLDNVLVLQMISSKFRLPWETTYMALVVLVLFQLLRSMIFYLVLASNLKSLEWLQYLLGVSLLYAAYQAVSGACEEEFDIMETQPMQLIKHCLGDRLVALPAKDEQTGVVDLAVMRTNGKGQVCLTMGGLMLACLLVADFVLNIDVALTKMEELQDRYMCLSSSALAAFTLPDVFPLIEGIFKRFPGLKYAVGFVFVFVGVQMLLYRVVTIPALLGVAIMVAVLLLGIASSVFLGWRAGGGTFASPPPA